MTNVQTAKKTTVAPDGAKQFDTRTTKESPRPLYLLLTTAVSIFVVEAFVMLLLSVLPPLSPQTEGILDAFMLTVLVFPALYFSLFRPMVLHITKYKQSQEALRQAYDNLEQQVAERTAKLKEANQALRQAEEKYRSIFENAVEGIFQTTVDGRYLAANRALARIYGYESPEELMEAVSDLNRQFYVEPSRREEFIRLIGKEGRTQEFESQVYCKDSSVIWISESARTVRDAGGGLIGFEGTTIDITGRKQAEEALRESEERFRSVAQSAIDAIVVADSKGSIISWNKAAQTVFGYGEGEALGKPLTLLMPERFHDSHRRGLDRFLSAGKSDTIGKTVEYVGKNKDGSEFPLELSLASWKTGEEVFFTGIIRDVTERKLAEEASKQAEEALRESEERFTAFMNNSPVVAWLKDPATWTYRYVNNAFEEVFGITREAISKKTDFDLWPEEIARQLRENDLRVMSSDKTIQTSEDVPLPDGTVHHWLVFKFPLHTLSGKSFLAGTAVDITERRQAEEQRERLILELKDALANVRQLGRLLPICASCKKIRDDKGYWTQVEKYVMDHSDATFSHGVCPECAQKLYPDYFKK
jgi:PAS domain S-box-containing protein